MRRKDRAHSRGPTRLLQIIISESAYLVWVPRCEKNIKLRNHSEEEIRNRWYAQINLRLTNDRILATKIKRDPRTKNMVTSTWKDVIAANPTSEWLRNKEIMIKRDPRYTATHQTPPNITRPTE
jgi:hypothetical protein